MSVGEGAHLAHLEVTLAGDAASHLATWLATLGEKATYRAFQLTAATGLARSNLFVTFKGEGAKLDISGAFLGRGAEHIDTTLVVDHAVPGCESRELFKGVLVGLFRLVCALSEAVRSAYSDPSEDALQQSEHHHFVELPNHVRLIVSVVP